MVNIRQQIVKVNPAKRLKNNGFMYDLPAYFSTDPLILVTDLFMREEKHENVFLH